MTAIESDIKGSRQGRRGDHDAAGDVDAQQRMVEALRASEASLRRLFEHAADAILTADHEGRVLDANARASELTGYAADELVGRPVSLLYPDSQQELAAEHLSQLQRGEPLLIERRLRRKDGSSIMVEVSAKRLPDGRLHGIIRSTAARRARSHRSYQLESLGQFTGGIAHDFNNLLTVILVNAHVLADEYAGRSSVPEELRDVIEAAERGSQMVKRLLRFARQEPSQLVPVSLGSLTQDLARTLRRLLPEHIDVAVDCAEAELIVMADPGAVEQIVLNLATNARDAMPEGGSLQMSVRHSNLGGGRDECGEEIAPGQYVTLSVSDTGTGIDEDTKRRMFEPFFTTKEQGKGTGLGLSMTCGLVREHKGVIQVRSQPGRGTTIDVSLPALTA